MVMAMLGGAPAMAGGNATYSLCTPHESTWFSCPVARGRSVALCGTPGLSPQYRFGRSGAVEMRFPEQGVEGAMLFAHYARYQTDRIEIRFTNQGVEYVVFDHIENGRKRAGVRVTTADSKEREVVCTGSTKSRLSELEGVLACDRDSALNGGVCR